MKKIVYAIFVIFILIGISHVFLWFLNLEMFHQIKKMTERERVIRTENLKPLRQKLEAEQKKSLKSYRWINQRKDYAEIPIERAFDYFIGRPKP